MWEYDKVGTVRTVRRTYRFIKRSCSVSLFGSFVLPKWTSANPSNLTRLLTSYLSKFL